MSGRRPTLRRVLTLASLAATLLLCLVIPRIVRVASYNQFLASRSPRTFARLTAEPRRESWHEPARATFAIGSGAIADPTLDEVSRFHTQDVLILRSGPTRIDIQDPVAPGDDFDVTMYALTGENLGPGFQSAVADARSGLASDWLAQQTAVLTTRPIGTAAAFFMSEAGFKRHLLALHLKPTFTGRVSIARTPTLDAVIMYSTDPVSEDQQPAAYAHVCRKLDGKRQRIVVRAPTAEECNRLIELIVSSFSPAAVNTRPPGA